MPLDVNYNYDNNNFSISTCPSTSNQRLKSFQRSDTCVFFKNGKIFTVSAKDEEWEK